MMGKGQRPLAIIEGFLDTFNVVLLTTTAALFQR
jgi:hypothetical protein